LRNYKGWAIKMDKRIKGKIKLLSLKIQEISFG
jgi:hypothetical protein